MIPIENDTMIAIIDLLLGLTPYVKDNKELVDGIWSVARVLLMTITTEGGEISLEDCKRWEKMGLIKPITVH